MPRDLRLVPSLLLGLGVALALTALVALPWYAVDGQLTTDPRVHGFARVLPPSGATGDHGLTAGVLVLITVAVAAGTLLPARRLTLAFRAAAPSLASAALLWTVGRTLLVLWAVSAMPTPRAWSVSVASGVAVESIGLVLLGVGAALGPRAHALRDEGNLGGPSDVAGV